MKKIIVSLIAVLALSVSAFAVDFSMGASVVGWGPTFARGVDFKEGIQALGLTKSKTKYNMAFSPVFQLTGQFDFVPSFALEFGVGYSMKKIGYGLYDFGSRVDAIISYSQVSVPLLLKLQYEIADLVNIYFAAGPKFNFIVSPPISTPYVDDKQVGSPLKSIKESYNIFNMDIGLAVGAELKIASAHYIGLRIGYDINVLGAFNKQDPSDPTKYIASKEYIDSLALSLTYRYKFGQ